MFFQNKTIDHRVNTNYTITLKEISTLTAQLNFILKQKTMSMSS